MATGFIVRNAADVGSTLDQAEPDALDFNLLSRHRYGVLSGCDGALAGSVFTVSQGVAVVDDLLVSVGGQVHLPQSSQQPRFDLITVDRSSAVGYVRGEPSPNPVFPDFDDTVTVLYAVYIPPGNLAPDPVLGITDKRRFLPQRFLSTATNGDLLASYASSPSLSAVYTVKADGRTEWLSDTRIYRSGPKTLQVEDNLNVLKKVTADSADITHDLVVHGDLSAANLLKGQGAPGVLAGTPGDLYQDQQNGGLWSYESGAWDRLSTTPIPPGYLMASLRTDEPDGWLILDGRDVSKPASGGLWDAFPQWRIDATTLRLPQANGMFLRQGPVGTGGGRATQPITVDNLPPHKHLDSPTTEAGGDHTHLATMEGAGDHSHYTVGATDGLHHHDTNKAEHFHEGVDGGAGGGFIGAFWGGTRRLDGPFNDASHPVSVEIVANTKPSPSHVEVLDGGTHQHFTNTVGPHTHPITIKSFDAKHVHNITERNVGGGQELPIIPPFLAVTYLIKT